MMEKKTLLAIVLSIGVLVIFYFVQGYFSSPKKQPGQENISGIEDDSLLTRGEAASDRADADLTPEDRPPETPVAAGQSQIFEAVSDDDEDYYIAENLIIKTDVLEVTFTEKGGDVVSWKLLKYKDKGNDVEMIFSDSDTADKNAFSLVLGNRKMDESSFKVKKGKDDKGNGEYIEFSRRFEFTGNSDINDQQEFTFKKRYEFKPSEYMCRLIVTFEGQGAAMAFNNNEFAYTLSFGPQIGPSFEKLDERNESRRFYTYSNDDKLNEYKTNSRVIDRPKWTAIAGKYFAFAAHPLIQDSNKIEWDFIHEEKPNAIPAVESRMNIHRPVWNQTAEKIEDKYFFYLGPKSQEELSRYNAVNQNDFGQSNMQISQIAKSTGFFSFIETPLKWLLEIIYKGVRNWGVAIILLTLLVKILFFPLTKKSSMATLRMQAVAPKIKELQAKYKDNRQKLNIEMAELYKKEGYNPLSGCLPMLLQIPIFFAMYSLFNNHFDLRGAEFIPGWIPDLSQPEGWQLDFSIPLLGNFIRLLPFIYVGSQLLYGKVTQVPNQQSTTQTKIMLYVMPIVFFFILYNMPSGLLIYWIFSNILTLVQQLIIQKYMLPKMADKTNNTVNVIAPNKKKR